MEQVLEILEYKKDLTNGIARKGIARHEPEEAIRFAHWLDIMNHTGIPYLVGGAFAVHSYTGIWRDTKDLDIFLRPEDVQEALRTLRKAGYRTEVAYPNWLAKVFCEPYLMDLIFGAWNGRLTVNDSWFSNNQAAEVAGVEVRLIGVEEMMTSKFFVAARDRFDGADIVHLIRGMKGKIDWSRVLSLLGENYELLLWHLILFDFVYPGHTDFIPRSLTVELFEKVKNRWTEEPEDSKKFRGALLDPFTYAVDLEDWGYPDPRDMRALVDNKGKRIEIN